MPSNKYSTARRVAGGPSSDHDIILACMDNIKHNLDFPETRQHQDSHIWMFKCYRMGGISICQL